MKKKGTPQKAFEKYWETYINEVIRRKMEFVIEKHQPEILEFRKKWGIPEKGFKNRRAYNKWYKAQLREFKKGSQIVHEQIGEVGILVKGFEFKFPKKLSPQKNDILSHKVGKGFFYFFRQRVGEFAYKIGLDTTWIYPFEDYIFFNHLDMRLLWYTGIMISLKTCSTKPNQEIGRQISLTFGPNTRLKDIKLIWKWQVKPVLKKFPGFLPNPPRKKRKTK